MSKASVKGGIEGAVGGIDLTVMEPSDYFKIGVSEGQQGFPQSYPTVQAYLDGYTFGQSMNPYAFTAGDPVLDRTATYELLRSRYHTNGEISIAFSSYASILNIR